MVMGHRMAFHLSSIMTAAHREARRLRDVHPLLRSKLPPYRVTFAKALKAAWEAEKRYAPVIAALAARTPSPAYLEARQAAFILSTKDRLSSADIAELNRLDAIPVYAA